MSNKMTCPVHDVHLQAVRTRYGFRYSCTKEGCTVACWDGSTSTPADDETRAARHLCHKLFDQLWKDRKTFKTRCQAYEWMSRFMGTKPKQTHIGMFDLEQCKKLLEHLEAQCES